MEDIKNREDITLMVNEFYSDVLKDDLISPFFKNLDFEHHLPKMIDFWGFVLLDEGGYKTDVTQTHLRMKIYEEHFDRWIALFNATVDRLFKGEKAELAKQRAFVIRWTVESKMNQK